MEDKIEVNEYVRTKEGFIYKIENGEEFYEDSVDVGIGIIPDVDGIWIDRECLDYIDKRDIVKHSKRLINLIEKDDYVNGSKVLAVMEDMETGELHLEMTSDYTNEEIGDCTIYDKDIKIILTKESYMANCYKVGGEDE